MEKIYTISNNNLMNLLEDIKTDYSVFVPVKKGNNRYYKKFSDIENREDIVLGEVRAFEPLKAFFFTSREKVAEDYNDKNSSISEKPKCIVGVKACDLKGFKTEDFVFNNEDFTDPFYLKNRENNLIISSDCTCAIETCFCIALGLKPYPEENFDINLSKIKDNYIAEAGSMKGKNLIEKYSVYFNDATSAMINEKIKQRNIVIKEVEKNIKDKKIPKQNQFKNIITKNYNSKLWEEESKTCVECGACNTICPTCHCFLLYDQKDGKKMERLRAWDSCMIKDFARVAGGANPREKLWMRLRNRFEKKFDYFFKVAEIYACTGCGRCISACPAKIDIRNVLKRLVENVK